MKSQPKAVLLLAALLIAAVAGAVGWIGRGMFTLRTTAPQGTAPPTAASTRTGSTSAASRTSQRSGGVSAEEPKAVAKRLLQAVIEGTQEEGSETLLKFRFQQALAELDETALEELTAIIPLISMDPRGSEFAASKLLRDCCQLLVMRMAALNPRKALDCQVGLAEAEMVSGPQDFALVMELLVAQNPAQVQKMIEDLPPGNIRASAQIAWLDARSNSDPEGVFQSLMNLDSEATKSGENSEVELRKLFNKLGLQAPEKALQAAALFPDDSMIGIKYDLVTKWAERDPKAAVKWALEQNDAQTLYTCLVYVPSENHALDEKTLRDHFLTINAKEPEDRLYLASELAARLAEQDIPEGVRWAATLPEDVREAANVPVAKAWIKQDAPGAAEWLATWPAGRAKDEAVAELTDAIVKDDPESALAWAASIQAKWRFSHMQKALDTLTGKDPAAAERAMPTLSEEDRAVLSAMKRTVLGE